MGESNGRAARLPWLAALAACPLQVASATNGVCRKAFQLLEGGLPVTVVLLLSGLSGVAAEKESDDIGV
jgi:hypothetical protein